MRNDRAPRIVALLGAGMAMGWLGFAVPAAAAPPATADGGESTQATTGGAPAAGESTPFVPSESIPPGTAVPFPVDI